MKTAGLDIGSRSIELVVVDAPTGQVLSAREEETTPEMPAVCRKMIDEASFDRMLVTGYGRAFAEVKFGCSSITEIKAFARGAQAVAPGCFTVLDIGGQDSKAIALDGSGKAINFEMNDRCAAGTGRFLEMIAAALDYELSQFGSHALSGREGVQISSMCAVFAESEVIGLLTRGASRQDIALAVHRAITSRAASMLARVGIRPPLVFAGGAARNECLVNLISETVKTEIFVPHNPQMLGALGAALIAAESLQ